MTREEGPLKWGLVCLLSSLVKVAFFEVHTKSRSRSEIFPVTNPATVSLTLPQFKLVSSVPESANLSFLAIIPFPIWSLHRSLDPYKLPCVL